MKALFRFCVGGWWLVTVQRTVRPPEPDAIAHRETSPVETGKTEGGDGGYDGIRTCDPRIMSAML